MKKLKIFCFTFCQWQFHTIALTATIPSLSSPGQSFDNLLFYNTTFPYNNTTPLNLNVRPPDPSSYDYGPPGLPSIGTIKIYNFGRSLFHPDYHAVTMRILQDCEFRLARTPDARLGRGWRLWAHGGVELTLRPGPAMTWRMWCNAYDQFVLNLLRFQLHFNITDFRIGYIGGGEMVKTQ